MSIGDRSGWARVLFMKKNQHEPSQREINVRVVPAVWCGWSTGHVLVGRDEGGMADITSGSRQEIGRVY